MEIIVTFGSSGNHPHLADVRRKLERHNDTSKYLVIDGYYYILHGKSIQMKLSELFGGLPDFLNGTPIIRVKVSDHGQDPAPMFGYYRSARAEGWATALRVEKDSWFYSQFTSWQLEIVAPTFDEAKQLYIEMRHSQAQPARGWSKEVNVPAGDLSPLDTLSPFASSEHKTQVAIQHLQRLLVRGEISMNELIAQLSQSSL